MAKPWKLRRGLGGKLGHKIRAALQLDPEAGDQVTELCTSTGARLRVAEGWE